MYIVKIKNGEITTEIHGLKEKLKSGNVVKGINVIDSFSFALLPSNKGFNRIQDFQTLVSVYNTNKDRYEFHGRVLYSITGMDTSGHISKDVTCESYLGFLCDSEQGYVEEKNWTVTGLLQHIIDVHNSQVEEYKHFTIGTVSVEDINVYVGIQRENSWKTIEEKLIKKLGGEITFRVVDDVIYLDYVKQLGSIKATEIALSKNMKAITKENDPSNYITRLIPYGQKLTKEVTTTDASGNETTQVIETEERLDITSVNDGKNYIDDETAIAAYGIHVKSVYFDDVSVASNLLEKGRQWLIDNNKVQVKYSISALDLSLLGLDIDDFDVCNYHPIKNALLHIDDTARIIKKTIDVREEVKSNIEVGDNFKTLSDMQIEQAGKIDTVTNTIGKIESNYVTNEKLSSENSQLYSLVQQSINNILISVESSYVSKSEDDEFRQSIATELEVLANQILMNFTTTETRLTEVDGRLTTEFTELYNYISFEGGNITLGQGGDAITFTIEHDAIYFSKNGVKFGSWDGDNFYTGNIVVRVNERAQFGNFAYIPRSDGSLSFLKVGD